MEMIQWIYIYIFLILLGFLFVRRRREFFSVMFFGILERGREEGRALKVKVKIRKGIGSDGRGGQKSRVLWVHRTWALSDWVLKSSSYGIEFY
jgi:hypothetical protein